MERLSELTHGNKIQCRATAWQAIFLGAPSKLAAWQKHVPQDTATLIDTIKQKFVADPYYTPTTEEISSLETKLPFEGSLANLETSANQGGAILSILKKFESEIGDTLANTYLLYPQQVKSNILSKLGPRLPSEISNALSAYETAWQTYLDGKLKRFWLEWRFLELQQLFAKTYLGDKQPIEDGFIYLQGDAFQDSVAKDITNFFNKVLSAIGKPPFDIVELDDDGAATKVKTFKGLDVSFGGITHPELDNKVLGSMWLDLPRGQSSDNSVLMRTSASHALPLSLGAIKQHPEIHSIFNNKHPEVEIALKSIGEAIKDIDKFKQNSQHLEKVRETIQKNVDVLKQFAKDNAALQAYVDKISINAQQMVDLAKDGAKFQQCLNDIAANTVALSNAYALVSAAQDIDEFTDEVSASKVLLSCVFPQCGVPTVLRSLFVESLFYKDKTAVLPVIPTSHYSMAVNYNDQEMTFRCVLNNVFLRTSESSDKKNGVVKLNEFPPYMAGIAEITVDLKTFKLKQPVRVEFLSVPHEHTRLNNRVYLSPKLVVSSSDYHEALDKQLVQAHLTSVVIEPVTQLDQFLSEFSALDQLTPHLKKDVDRETIKQQKQKLKEKVAALSEIKEKLVAATETEEILTSYVSYQFTLREFNFGFIQYAANFSPDVTKEKLAALEQWRTQTDDIFEKILNDKRLWEKVLTEQPITTYNLFALVKHDQTLVMHDQMVSLFLALGHFTPALKSGVNRELVTQQKEQIQNTFEKLCLIKHQLVSAKSVHDMVRLTLIIIEL